MSLSNESQSGTFLSKLRANDLVYSFLSSWVTILAAGVAFVLITAALLAPLIAPMDPYNSIDLELANAFLPPFWVEGGRIAFPLGTDDQGRDMLSAMLYGLRVSLLVGFGAVAFALVLGVFVGLVSGYKGGIIDAFLMRTADIQLTFPAILIALIVDGLARGFLPRDVHNEMRVVVLVTAIGLSNWVQFARTVRGSTLVEARKEYVEAAQLVGRLPIAIMIRHILPNVIGPILVISTISLAVAIITEATLSYLGVGMPPSRPSLGSLINTGQNFLFSGMWWIAIFPGCVLAMLALSVNLLGDWLRDALNPKLR